MQRYGMYLATGLQIQAIMQPGCRKNIVNLQQTNEPDYIMKFYTLLNIVASAMFVTIFPACHADNDELGHHHQGGGEEADAAGHSHGEIVLDPHMAEKMGVTTEKVHPDKFSDIIHTSGAVVESPGSASVVPAPVSGSVRFASGVVPGAKIGRGAVIASVSTSAVAGGDANEAARVALVAAKAELDRVTPLHADGIVSTRDFNAARAAYDAARAAYSAGASSGAAKAPASGVISALLVSEGAYVNAGDAIAQIASSEDMTLRADLPERYAARASTLTSARVGFSSTDSLFTLTRCAVPVPATTTPGYVPVYFTFRSDGSIPVGAIADVYLLGRERNDVMSVPVAAISEQQGNTFVFVRLDENCYHKVPVKTGASDGARIEILSGLEPGADVVVAGATAVRLAESSGVVPEGHSHNH